jgi:hypothetical protein
MLAIQEVRRELREIRYYYSKQKIFDNATKEIPSSVIETVSRYNQAIKNAPARLYDLYIHLYVQNNTQEALAYDWDYSNDYIKQLNKQLCEYLQSVME